LNSGRPSESKKNALWGSGPRDERANALWGSGRTGKRSNALWGRGGRGGVIAVVAALTLVIPLAAGAHGTDKGPGKGRDSYVSPGLLQKAKDHKSQKLHVIIQSTLGASDADARLKGLGASLRRRLDAAGAVAVDLPAGKIEELSKKPNLTITPDAPVKLSAANYSKELWPYESGNARLWGTSLSPAPATPTIAIIDSGIDAKRADFDFGARVLPQVNMTSLTPNSAGDGRGHGTFVAGIAAGSAPGYAGASPNSRILPIDVMDDSGKALTSDVIASCDYILANKAALNIRVANFSLHSAATNHFYNDPLDRAVEKLWFNGVFVVAAAGNYGSASGPSGVLHAPGNDPFVMTVGAIDLGTSVFKYDDAAAPWSAWGYTEDGFAKPELGAPGRYMVGPVSANATLATERADHVVEPGYMELSGTSFAAPVVAGTVAQILARHPGWTPDQVKGVLMATAKRLPKTVAGSAGAGELNAYAAATYGRTPPNPNKNLNAFLTSTTPGSVAFDAASWGEVVGGNASWSTASWSDASWSEVSFDLASWAEMAFSDASWAGGASADASWADASWAEASWSDTSTEDSAEGDNSGPAPLMDATAAADLQADPDLALSPEQVAEDPVVNLP
jgi:serine protease AprX